MGWIVLFLLAGGFLWLMVWFFWDGLTSAWNQVHGLISPAERERRKQRQAVVDKYQIKTVSKPKNARERAKAEEERIERARRIAVEREVARQSAEYDAAVERVTKHAELHQEFGAEPLPMVPLPGTRKTSADDSWAKDARYGEAHKRLREGWKPIIRQSGIDCAEAICIFPTRRIEAGASGRTWELAHNHAEGGPFNYLGPAHRECNQAEALARGVTWPGSPALSDLLDEVGYTATYPVVRQPQDGDLIRTFVDKYGGIFEEVWETDNGPDPWGNGGPEELRRVQRFLAGPYDHPENEYRRMDAEGTRTTEGLLPPFY